MRPGAAGPTPGVSRRGSDGQADLSGARAGDDLAQ